MLFQARPRLSWPCSVAEIEGVPPGAVVPSFLAGSLPVGSAAAGMRNPALAATPNPTPAPTPIPEPVYSTSCVLNLAGNFQGGMPGIITNKIAIPV